MHELGLVVELVERAEMYAAANNISRINRIVLSAGEGFSVVPPLMRKVYRTASEGTVLEGSVLELNIIEASAVCHECGIKFNPLREKGVCPGCQGSDYDVLTGKEFEITEIEISE